MKTYYLLLGIACAPALASCILTLPLWFFRKLRNDDIRRITLLVLTLVVIGCYIPVFLDDTQELGILFIPLSLVNFLLLRLCTHVLYTRRCPECRSLSLRIISSNHHRKYLLRCRRCGMTTSWRP